MLEQNEIQTIIKNLDTKTDNKIDIPKIQRKLQEILEPKNISFCNFYKLLIEELNEILLFNMTNLITKNNIFLTNSENLYLLYKTFDIFFAFTHCCLSKDQKEIFNEDKLNNFYQTFINILIKIKEIYKNNNDNNIKGMINQFCQYIYDAIKILLDINIHYIIQIVFDEKNKSLLEKSYTRVIIYDILKKVSTSKEIDFKSLIKEKQSLINDSIKYLSDNCDSNNIIQIIDEIKTLSKIFKNNINDIRDIFFYLIKKILDLYSKELDNQYKDLFFFFFNDIIFEESIDKNRQVQFNKEFLNFLFDVYNYLISSNKRDLIDIFLMKFYESINYNDLKEGKEKGKNILKFKWLVKETNYYDAIVKTFPEIFSKNFFLYYSGALMNLSDSKTLEGTNEKDCCLPETDFLIFFLNFDKYINNENYKKEDLIVFFAKQITTLMDINKNISKIILQKSNAIEIIIELIKTEKEYNVKIKLFDFINKILSVNNNKYEYILSNDILDKVDDISLKINLILIGKEINSDKFNKKFNKLIDIMKKLYDDKKINEFLEVMNLIFIIITEYQFKKINLISDDIILNINNLLIQMSSFLANSPKNKDSEIILGEYVVKFLNSIIQFIYKLNMKIFEYKSQNKKEKPLYYTKRIIEKKNLKNIFRNMLLTETNEIVQQKTYDYLLNFSIDEKNNLIISSYILYIIVNIFYQDKNYNNLKNIFDKLLNLIKIFDLNSKILLNYDFVSITLDIMQEIYIKDIKEKDEEECYKSAYLFLEEISKYLNQELLMKYINKLFILFKKNILVQSSERKKSSSNLYKVLFDEKNSFASYNSKEDMGRVNVRNNNMDNLDSRDEEEIELEIVPDEEEENDTGIINEEENKSKDCYDLINLFHILKNYLKKYNEISYDFVNNNTSNYIILSNKTFPNHLINNILFIDNLFYNNTKDNYVDIRMVIKINTYDGLSNFTLLQLKDNDDDNKIKLIFTIDKKNLEIKEEGPNHKKTLCIFKDFDTILPADNQYHDLIISFIICEKSIKISIDKKEITQKIKNYNLFIFKCFNLIIGFKNKFVDDKTNDINLKFSNNEINSKKAENKSNIYVYISYLLIFNTLIGNIDLTSYMKNEKNCSPNGNILSRCFRKNNINWAKNVITEIDFQNKNINLAYSEEIKVKISDIYKYIFTNNSMFVKKFISFIQTPNAFNDDVRTSSLYMISKNHNIYEYYSLNYFCELEKLNKLNISSKIFDNYDLFYNFCNIYIFDFLIGFLFIIETKFDELRKKEKNNEEDANKVKKDVSSYFSEENILLNGDLIGNYILEILEIMILIPSENIINYFLNGDSKSNILKLKYFFYRNINLLNDENNISVEKIIKIFSSEKTKMNYMLKNKVILEILNEIFLNPIFFEKLSLNNQNFLIFYLSDFVEQIKEMDSMSSECLHNIVINLVKIIIYNKLKDDKNQINSIVDSINKLIQLFFSSPNNECEKKIKIYFARVYEISSNLTTEIKEHINKEFYEKYKYIFTSYKNEDNKESKDILDNEIDKISDNINNFISLITKNQKLLSCFSNELKSTDCNFCNYLEDIFYLKSKFIYEEFIYNKLYQRFFRNYYLNFGNNSDIFDKKKYAWFLSFKESHEKIQNKLFLKEDYINSYSYENPKTKKIINYFLYDYGKEKFIKVFKVLSYLSCIDKICLHKNLISTKYIKSNKNIFNCLIVNKLHKILSTIILTNDAIYICYNIFLDEKSKINIVNSQPTHSIWTKNKQDFEKELKEYIIKNEDEIKKEIYQLQVNEEKSDTKNKPKNKFNYDKSYKFCIKTINLRKIIEIHKRYHLHIPNSLEIFLKNGDSYFIVLNPENRDIFFEQIIKKINELYKDKENKSEIYNNSKITSSTKEKYFYMRYSPILTLNQENEGFLKIRRRKGSISDSNNSNYKVILDENALKDEIANEWSKNKISNYDYLMLLNILSGRSLKEFSQYFVFPWIIQDFNTDEFNWLNDKIYRDLSMPIHACGDDKERIKNKYELLDDEKYHSGTFYSTHTFICYYLIRLRPFTEIHLEIQGAKFDAPTRMFNGAEQLSSVTEKYQELIPALFNFPELYIKINYIFNDDQNLTEPISEYQLPTWSKNDPRKLTLIFRKMLESDKISQKLNLWIDLIFGYKQKGQNAVKSLNIYRNACYFFEKNELENLQKNNEIESYLYEKEEMGVVGKQLFTKNPHKTKDINLENIKTKQYFFNDRDKVKNIFIEKIKNHSYHKLIKDNKNHKSKDNKNNKIIINNSAFDKKYDIIFGFTSPLYNKIKKIYCQGGISSLPSIMDCLSDIHSKNIMNANKIVDLLEKEKNFVLLNENYKYLRQLNLFITYDKKTIELISISKAETLRFLYFLDEIGDISCLTTNQKGTKLFIGFSNGLINEYKIVKILKNHNKEQNTENVGLILPITLSELTEICSEYKNILYSEDAINNFSIYQDLSNFRICLKKMQKNYFSYNNPHIPKKINILSLNEYHNVLIALDESNLLYIISLNNNYKLMNISHFLSNTQYRMKEILPLSWNGDFIIYSSYVVNLFTINGIPLCQLNLFEKNNETLYSITCCKAVFLYDVILFTAHKDGCIIIWKIRTKISNSKKPILEEYSYGYNTKNFRHNKAKVKNYELQREFEKIRTIYCRDDSKTYFNFMKMSSDLNYMILIDNKKNLYIMTNKKENFTLKSFHKIKNKDKCSYCNKNVNEKEIKPIDINLFENRTKSQQFEAYFYTDKDNKNSQNMKIDNNQKIICEECKNRLEHSENFLYDY